MIPSVIQSVRAERLTYLDEAALGDLFKLVKGMERRSAPGVLIEAGCALGGSAIVTASAKAQSRPFFIYDVFGMIPPPSENDDADVHERYKTIKEGKSKGIKGNKYYGYEENLLEKVTDNFRRHGVETAANNIHLVQGLFQDTLRIDQPVALAHIDGDWYDSVITCLRRIEPQFVKGSTFVIDDYYTWSGCRKAVDEYFSDKKDKYSFVRRSRLHIVKT